MFTRTLERTLYSPYEENYEVMLLSDNYYAYYENHICKASGMIENLEETIKELIEFGWKEI